MKYIKPINEFWGDVLKRDLLGETREEDKLHTWEELREYLKSEIEKQGENVVIQNLDVSLIEDLSELFYGISYGVKTLDLSGWKTSGVKYMNEIFYNCIDLESLNVSGWDTSNVKNMGCMFYSCRALKFIDLSSWDTSNVVNMSGIFYDCKSLESLDLSGWSTSKANNMSWMFGWCPSLKSLDLSGWDTSNVDNMSCMFSGCNNLKSLDLSGWDTSKVYDKGMSGMFNGCPAPYKVIDNKIVKK